MPVSVSNINSALPVSNGKTINKSDNKPTLSNPSILVSNAPPDDAVGDVMPFGVFALTQGNNLLSDVDKIAALIKRPQKNADLAHNNQFKIQKATDKIPMGIIAPSLKS